MIGGNTTFEIQRLEATQNEIGEDIKAWSTVYTGAGFLDMMTGDSNRIYDAKLAQSTHVIVSDYFDFRSLGIRPEGHRVTVNGEAYELTYIDDPMELHEHIEAFLKRLGGV